MFFKRSAPPTKPSPIETETISRSAPVASKKVARQIDNILLNSPLYQFKRDVLTLVAQMNQGASHTDYDLLKKQTMFIQSQLLHALTHDPSIPGSFKIMLMEYHAKSVRATLTDRRGENERD